jgi:hypothetical protein
LATLLRGANIRSTKDFEEIDGWSGMREMEEAGRKMAGSCWELDANYLSARGCLEPGWSGTCQQTLGNEVASINRRAEAGQLHLSWRGEEQDGDGEREDMAEIIPIRPEVRTRDRGKFLVETAIFAW